MPTHSAWPLRPGSTASISHGNTLAALLGAPRRGSGMASTNEATITQPASPER